MNWPTAELNQVADLERKTIHPNDAAPSTRYVGLEHVDGSGAINWSETVKSADLRSNKFSFSDQHVLFGKLRPYLRKIARPEFSGVCSTDIIPILPKGTLDRDYLFYFLRTPDMVDLADSRSSGANLPRLSPKQLATFQIPLPPLAEQKRIAAILDAADAMRAKRRETLAQLDTLLQSTFLELFGDPVTNQNTPTAVMSDLITKFIDYRGKSPEKSAVGTPLITAKIIKDQEVKKPNEFIPDETYDAWMRRGIPVKGDVIITTEAPMGEVALVPDYKAAYAQRLLVLQPDRTKINPLYLLWALTMPFVKEQLRQRSTGSTVTGIRSKEFKKIELPIASLAVQRRFATIVESIERQKSRMRAHLAELDTLFVSLQSRAFNGEL